MVSSYYLEPHGAFNKVAVIFRDHRRLSGTGRNFFWEKRGFCDGASNGQSMDTLWPAPWGYFDCMDVSMGE